MKTEKLPDPPGKNKPRRGDEQDQDDKTLDQDPAQPTAEFDQVSTINQGRRRDFSCAFSFGSGQDVEVYQIGTNELAFLVFAAGIVVALGRVAFRIFRRYRPKVRLGDFMIGTVYIMLDKSFLNKRRPEWVIKIGMTQRKNVEERKIEVMRDMGGDLDVIYALKHVPFPLAVEFVAHQFMSRSRIYWPRGSTRGREWFKLDGERGVARAVASVEKAARRVRRVARGRRRWPAKADMRVLVSRYIEGKILSYKLFR